MFNGQGCQMSVGDKIGCGLPLEQHVLKKCPVLMRWPDNSCAGLIKPALNTKNSLGYGQRPLKNPGIATNPDKG